MYPMLKVIKLSFIHRYMYKTKSLIIHNSYTIILIASEKCKKRSAISSSSMI